MQERALIYAILRRMPDFKGHAASREKFMIMDAVKAWDGWAKWNFENRVAECEKDDEGCLSTKCDRKKSLIIRSMKV